jgi:hypothetical protein
MANIVTRDKKVQNIFRGGILKNLVFLDFLPFFLKGPFSPETANDLCMQMLQSTVLKIINTATSYIFCFTLLSGKGYKMTYPQGTPILTHMPSKHNISN